jgi:hypothetical protein
LLTSAALTNCRFRPGISLDVGSYRYTIDAIAP